MSGIFMNYLFQWTRQARPARSHCLFSSGNFSKPRCEGSAGFWFTDLMFSEKLVSCRPPTCWAQALLCRIGRRKTHPPQCHIELDRHLACHYLCSVYGPRTIYIITGIEWNVLLACLIQLQGKYSVPMGFMQSQSKRANMLEVLTQAAARNIGPRVNIGCLN